MTGRKLFLLFSLLPILGAAPPSAEDPTHWAFRSPKRPSLPVTKLRSKLANPIDAFIAVRLEKVDLKPAPRADRTTLLRRLSFSLIGLPPSPEEIESFLADKSPNAYERQVDRLLSSPHYGERWAQHWLDVARYAETNGYELDGERPQAWRYRDWVIQAMNGDLPYDQFVTQQLAGDLLAKDSPDKANLLIAAGFNRCGPIHQVSGNIDPLEVRHELLNEMTAGVGAAFLGLTMTCARCHDHKFDPISQEEYFRLEAFFSRTKPKEIDLSTPAERVVHTKEQAVLQAKLLPLRKEIAEIEAPYRKRIREEKLAKLEPTYRQALDTAADKRTAEQKKLVEHANILLRVSWDEVVEALNEPDRVRRAGLRRQLHDLQARGPQPLPRAWTLEEEAGKLETHVLRRGNIHRRGKKVTPGYPVAVQIPSEITPKNRLDLARWLTRVDHPLTARVIVNRVWQHHFGAGIVRTPNDFGLKGERPTHPELLDWLTMEFVENGWSLKHLHRLIVTSSTYQQSSRVNDSRAAELDPENRLLWRMNRRRLEAEALRDSMLAVTGELTPKLGGPMVRVPLEPEVYDLIFTEGEPDGLWPITPDEREHSRRTVYLHNKRNVRLPMLEAFDQPDTLSSCPVRSVSTFAPQALILLNGPFTQAQSRALASRVWREVGQAPEEQIARVYHLALGRGPTVEEKRDGLQFLEEQTRLLHDRLRIRATVTLPEPLPEGADPAQAAALADLCLAMLNRNAFVFVE